MRAIGFIVVLVLLAAGIGLFFIGRIPAGNSAPRPRPESSPATPAGPAPIYDPQAVGQLPDGRPWITHLAIADLDDDGLPDILVCDGQSNSVRWIRQLPDRSFAERQLGDTIMAPAHVEATDFDLDGDTDLLVASMGQIFPNNDPIGAVVILENTGEVTFRNRVVAERIARVTDVRAADLDGDGDNDFVVGQFGYDQGEIRWMRNDGNWTFTSRQLLGLSGTIHTPVADFDGDGRPDFAALISQEWEEIHFFGGGAPGTFERKVIWGSTNEDYGSSGLDLADVDRDGDLDLIYTNGDGFDYARPGPRPWHGMQWLENRGDRTFAFHRVGNLPGAYGPVCVDLDGDGDRDLAAVSGFNTWERPDAVSFMAWLNDGAQNFTPVVLAQKPTHLMTLAAGDLDGDGIPELVTGGFHAYPPWDHMSRVLVWKRR